MKKLIAALSLAVVIATGLLGLGVGITHAQANRMLITCPHGTPSQSCDAFQDWSGNNWGATTDVQLANPGMTCANGEYFIRWMKLPHSGASDSDVYMGEEICGKTANLLNNFCNTDNLQLVFFVLHPDGTDDGECATPSSTDINNTIDYVVQDNTATGDIVGSIFGEKSATHYFAYSASVSRTNVFSDIDLEEGMVSGNFTNHRVWGGGWTNNQYNSVSGTGFHDQSGTGLGFFNVGDPTQMFWHSTPAGSSNNGGTMYSCEYPSGTSCTLGS